MSDRKSIASLLTDEQKEGWFETNIVANAPLIIGLFSNLVVIFADYRAYDVVYSLTGVWWKALAASLACAVPFILWEIGWQYNHTTENWRMTSLGMAGVAFATSIFLGVADYIGLTSPAWADFLLGSVVVLTGLHTVVGFLYYYNDPDVARRRMKAQALARAEAQRVNADMARGLLEDGRNILKTIDALKGEFSPDDVEAVLAILNGKRGKQQPKPRQQQTQPARSFASETENPTKQPSNK